MEVFPTFFAEVFIWARLFGHYSDAGAMLPNLANVALHKKSSRIVGNVGRKYRIDIVAVSQALLGVLVKGWRPGILVVPTDAAHSLVLVLYVVFTVCHLDGFDFRCCPISLFSLSTSISQCRKRVVGCDRIFWRFGRERPCRCRFLRRSSFVEMPRIALGATRGTRCSG